MLLPNNNIVKDKTIATNFFINDPPNLIYCKAIIKFKKGHVNGASLQKLLSALQKLSNFFRENACVAQNNY